MFKRVGVILGLIVLKYQEKFFKFMHYHATTQLNFLSKRLFKNLKCDIVYSFIPKFEDLWISFDYWLTFHQTTSFLHVQQERGLLIMERSHWNSKIWQSVFKSKKERIIIIATTWVSDFKIPKLLAYFEIFPWFLNLVSKSAVSYTHLTLPTIYSV